MKLQNFLVNVLLWGLGAFIVVIGYSFAEKFIWEREHKVQITKKNLRVEVLNGTEVSKLAEKVTAELRERGFDVVYFGNSPKLIEQTVIFDRNYPDRRAGKILGKDINCSRIYFEADQDKLIDISLILGKDYLRYFQNIEQEWE